MMSLDKQTIIESKLSKLSSKQLVAIWDTWKISFASPDARLKAMDIDPGGLIAPVLADCEYEQVLEALKVVTGA